MKYGYDDTPFRKNEVVRASSRKDQNQTKRLAQILSVLEDDGRIRKLQLQFSNGNNHYFEDGF